MPPKVDPSRARAQQVIGEVRAGVAKGRAAVQKVKQLGAAAGGVSVGELFEVGLGLLLDDILGPPPPPKDGDP